MHLPGGLDSVSLVGFAVWPADEHLAVVSVVGAVE